MRRLTTTFLAAALAVAIASSIYAQPPGGFGGMMARGPGLPQLVANKSVQEELKLTDEQKDKAKKISEEMGKKMRELFSPDADREKMQEESLTREEVQKDLKLTDKQKDEIKEIGKEMQKDIQEIFSGGFDPSKAQENMKKIQAIQKENLAKVAKTFSEDQKKTWTEMVGKDFDYKPEFRRPGGGN